MSVYACSLLQQSLKQLIPAFAGPLSPDPAVSIQFHHRFGQCPTRWPHHQRITHLKAPAFVHYNDEFGCCQFYASNIIFANLSHDVDNITIILNSSPPSAVYIRHWIGSALVRVMVCRLFGAKPLSKPMLGHYQLDSLEQTPGKF